MTAPVGLVIGKDDVTPTSSSGSGTEKPAGVAGLSGNDQVPLSWVFDPFSTVSDTNVTAVVASVACGDVA